MSPQLSGAISSRHSTPQRLRARARLALVLLAGLSLFAGGCRNVKPWERDNLATYGMRPDRDPVGMDLREHMWFSREASNGGRSIGGGGCGCN